MTGEETNLELRWTIRTTYYGGVSVARCPSRKNRIAGDTVAMPVSEHLRKISEERERRRAIESKLESGYSFCHPEDDCEGQRAWLKAEGRAITAEHRAAVAEEEVERLKRDYDEATGELALELSEERLLSQRLREAWIDTITDIEKRSREADAVGLPLAAQAFRATSAYLCGRYDAIR